MILKRLKKEIADDLDVKISEQASFLNCDV